MPPSARCAELPSGAGVVIRRLRSRWRAGRSDVHPDRHGQAQRHRSAGLARRRAPPPRRPPGLQRPRTPTVALEKARRSIRILFEVRVDIELFMDACAADSAAAAHKVLDAMMLQKISQRRQSKFVGLSSVPGAPTPEKMLEREKEIVAEYGRETADKMRRNGFAGLLIEERAKRV